MTRFFLFVMALGLSYLSAAQSWQQAHWQTTEGLVDSGEIRIPKGVITGTRSIATRTPYQTII